VSDSVNIAGNDLPRSSRMKKHVNDRADSIFHGNNLLSQVNRATDRFARYSSTVDRSVSNPDDRRPPSSASILSISKVESSLVRKYASKAIMWRQSDDLAPHRTVHAAPESDKDSFSRLGLPRHLDPANQSILVEKIETPLGLSARVTIDKSLWAEKWMAIWATMGR